MHLPRRVLAASALAAAALTTATGCTATNPQQTAEPYSPGAAAATTLGTVHVAGLFVASAGEGPAALVARIVNTGTDAATVEISDQGSSGLSGSFDVDPASTLDVGPTGEDGPEVDSLDSPPGTVLEMTIATGGRSTTVAVPVLDGTLEQYAPYVPTAAPSSSPSTTPTPEVTSSPSATGTRTGSPSPSRSASASPSGTASASATG